MQLGYGEVITSHRKRASKYLSIALSKLNQVSKLAPDNMDLILSDETDSTSMQMSCVMFTRI